MKKQLFLVAFLLVVKFATAQVSLGVIPLKDYADFKKRTLIVVTEEPLPKLESKLSPEQVQVYKQEIEEYNTLVKWAVDTYYKVGNPVEFKTRAEAKNLKANGKGTYAFLEFTKFYENYDSKVGFELVQKNRFAKDQTRLGGALSLGSMLSRIDIRIAEDYALLDNSQSVDPLYGQYLPNPFPNKADIAYAFRQIAKTMELREKGITYDKAEKAMREETAKLKTMPLLISENDIDPQEDREKFLKGYEYNAEIVSDEKVDDAIVNHAEQAITLTIPTVNKQTEKSEFIFVVYDCNTGNILTSSLPQDKNGASASPASFAALKSLKKAATESKIPGLTKENMMEFSRAAK